MGTPFYKTQRNKRTGQIRQLVSNDDGQTWEVSSGAPGAPEPEKFDMDFEKDPPTMMEQAGQAARGVGETLYDGSVGMGQGLSSGFSDEVMGSMPGQSIDEQRAIDYLASKRSPWAYPAGKGIGAGIQAVAAAPARGAGLLADAASAGMQGMASGLGESVGSLYDRALAALAGGGLGFGGGAAVGGLTKGVGAGAKAAGELADNLRGAAISTPAMRQKLMQEQLERGVPIDEAVDFGQAALGRKAEEFGLANKVVPQSAQGYAQKLGGVREQYGQQIGDALDEAGRMTGPGAQGAHGLADNVVNGLEGIRRNAAADRSGLGAPGENAAQELLDRMHPQSGMMSPRSLHTLKREYEAGGGFRPGEIGTYGDSAKRAVNRDAAGVARNELGEAMDLALPETREAFDTANRQYAVASTMKTLAEDRAVHDAARNMPVLHGAGWASGGALLGGGNPLGAAAGLGAGVAARKFGNDAGANGMRAIEYLAGMSGRVPTASTAGQAGGRAAASAQREQAANDGRGHLMESAARQMLQQNPQALGQYAQRFQEAVQSGDPMKMTALIAELNRDPQFRMTVGQDLLRMTNPRQGGSSQ